jgi:hypothetical protein
MKMSAMFDIALGFVQIRGQLYQVYSKPAYKPW